MRRTIIALALLTLCTASMRFSGGRLLLDGRRNSTSGYYLLIGQSNADGRPANATALAGYDLPTAGLLYSEPLRTYWINGNYVYSTNWSLEVPLAVSNLAPIVKVSKGSTTLAVDWAPDTGMMWARLTNGINAAVSAAQRDHGISMTGCLGVVWYQGESDALNSTYAAAYQSNLTNIIARVRTLTGSPSARWVTCRINTYYGDPADNTAVRTAQTNAETLVSNYYWINTDDANAGAHADGAGLVTIGERAANAMD